MHDSSIISSGVSKADSTIKRTSSGSNDDGTYTATAVFVKGASKISDYRRFKFKSDDDTIVGIVRYPEVVNFPKTSIHSRNGSFQEQCVMCGDPNAVIAAQNKSICKLCDSSYWLLNSSKIVVKFCKGCKNFATLSEFEEKPEASKCGRCRRRGRTNYFIKKNGNICSSDEERDHALNIVVEPSITHQKHVQQNLMTKNLDNSSYGLQSEFKENDENIRNNKLLSDSQEQKNRNSFCKTNSSTPTNTRPPTGLKRPPVLSLTTPISVIGMPSQASYPSSIDSLVTPTATIGDDSPRVKSVRFSFDSCISRTYSHNISPRTDAESTESSPRMEYEQDSFDAAEYSDISQYWQWDPASNPLVNLATLTELIAMNSQHHMDKGVYPIDSSTDYISLENLSLKRRHPVTSRE